MNKAELDEALAMDGFIVDEIGRGTGRSHALYWSAVRYGIEAKPENPSQEYAGRRAVDRSLQRLRKSGRIKFDHACKLWKLEGKP